MAGMVTDAGPRAEGAAGSATVKHLFQCIYHGAHPAGFLQVGVEHQPDVDRIAQGGQHAHQFRLLVCQKGGEQGDAEPLASRRQQQQLGTFAHTETGTGLATAYAIGGNFHHIGHHRQPGATGQAAAQVGILALSLAINPELAGKGGYALIPDSLHAPLEQGFVITKRAAGSALAKRFADYMGSKTARAVMARAASPGAVSPDHCSSLTGLSAGARRELMYAVEPTISRSRSMV